MRSDTEIREELKRLTEGLLFMSESDYPFEVFEWKEMAEVNPQFLRGLTDQAADAPVEILSVDDFFSLAASDEGWRGDESRTEAKKYRALVQSLKHNLADLKVYRVGKINMPVYIVGRSPAGNWLGISTRIVET